MGLLKVVFTFLALNCLAGNALVVHEDVLNVINQKIERIERAKERNGNLKSVHSNLEYAHQDLFLEQLKGKIPDAEHLKIKEEYQLIRRQSVSEIDEQYIKNTSEVAAYKTPEKIKILLASINTDVTDFLVKNAKTLVEKKYKKKSRSAKEKGKSLSPVDKIIALESDSVTETLPPAIMANEKEQVQSETENLTKILFHSTDYVSKNPREYQSKETDQLFHSISKAYMRNYYRLLR